MTCEKCSSDRMERTNAFRSSGCLVAAGFGLLASALVAVPLAILLAIGGTKGTSQATSTHFERAKVDAIERLEKVAELPPHVVADFRRDNRIPEETIEGLSLEQQIAVRQVVIDYGIAIGAAGTAGAIVGGVGTLVVVSLLVFGIPGTLIGLLLVRRRKLWRCGACGYAFECT